jgi:6-phosphogluconolactonase/glucosamine-6-phosphate isomerase/deaminase
MEVITLRNEQEALHKAADTCNHLLEEYSNCPVLFLSSGGSSLNILPLIDTRNLGRNVTIAVLDERYSFDEKINNYLQIMFIEGFYSAAIENGCTFISTYPDQMETMTELADNFDVALRKWRRENPHGVIVATVGVGPDGHTSGILPFPEAPEAFDAFFNTTDRWVVAYDALDKNPYPLRVTVTFPFLREQVDHAVTYTCGESKKESIRRIFADEGALAETPARVLREMRDVTLITDQKI